MTTRADFVIHPELHVRGEPERGIRPAYETRRTIRTLDDAVGYRLKERVPDLVLLDWMLPGLSGILLTRLETAHRCK
jgi:DNA-binding response OmpR family regulator